jgi:hypothetical protein
VDIIVGTKFVKAFSNGIDTCEGVVTGLLAEDNCTVSFDHGEETLSKTDIEIWMSRGLKPSHKLNDENNGKIPLDWMAISTFIWVALCVLMLVCRLKVSMIWATK